MNRFFTLLVLLLFIFQHKHCAAHNGGLNIANQLRSKTITSYLKVVGYVWLVYLTIPWYHHNWNAVSCWCNVANNVVQWHQANGIFWTFAQGLSNMQHCNLSLCWGWSLAYKIEVNDLEIDKTTFMQVQAIFFLMRPHC